MNPVIIAHRGASALARHENTLEAFKIAIKLKADYVEFDIRKTKDNQLIVFHDDEIDNKAISTLTYDRLCSITSRENYRVPLLSEVLELCKGKIKLDIELKESGYEKRIVDMVTKLYRYDEFMMKSFIDSAVKAVHDYDPYIKTGLLLGKKGGSLKTKLHEFFPMTRLAACNADFVSPYYKLATVGFIKRMKLYNKPVYVWTVNRARNIGKCILNHVDGIITDKPNVGLNVRNYMLEDIKRKKRFLRKQAK
ncbi:MAG: glycerophosphodiester phosphodiesterase [Lachnospiraceae bacterium]|nr:glycerophosphodiester phosphodiesterase [Lachnospiraceae bacterium]